MIKLGGPIFGAPNDPEGWVNAHRKLGYTAALCPVDVSASAETVNAYAEAAKAGGLIIAEVGAWSNPISADEEERKAAIRRCCEMLDLADRIGALCCVNIAGSRGAQWDGPHRDNLTPKTFEMIVDTVREIIDNVKPSRTFYTLETMPWIFPHTPESYLKLIEAIDRKAFAVHLDIVNLVYSPELLFDNANLINRCFDLLGPHIKGCHAKDVTISGKLTVHIDEVRPGLGEIEWPTLLRRLASLPEDIPLILEHLPTSEEYDAAAAFIRSATAKEGIVSLPGPA